jgi:hypothetical protein
VRDEKSWFSKENLRLALQDGELSQADPIMAQLLLTSVARASGLQRAL